MLDRFLPRTEFDSYDDFRRNYALDIPEGFNFGYDVVDEWARLDAAKPALVWCGAGGGERRYTFGDVKERSDRAANMFAALGIARGDAVMLMLKQRPEVWFCMVGLHKLGAVVIPASYQLTAGTSSIAATPRA